MKLAPAIIRDEHQTLSAVVATLQHLARNGCGHGQEPDFPLLRVTVNFLDVFSGRLHHPREEAYLFSVLRDKISGMESVLDGLEEGHGPASGLGGLRHRVAEAGSILDEVALEHRCGAEMIGDLQRTLAWYRNGESHGKHAFFAAVNAFAGFQKDHFRKEEYIVLPLAESILSEEDWRMIDSVFREKIDPLVDQALGHLSNTIVRCIGAQDGGNGINKTGCRVIFRPQCRAK